MFLCIFTNVWLLFEWLSVIFAIFDDWTVLGTRMESFCHHFGVVLNTVWGRLRLFFTPPEVIVRCFVMEVCFFWWCFETSFANIGKVMQKQKIQNGVEIIQIVHK